MNHRLAPNFLVKVNRATQNGAPCAQKAAGSLSSCGASHYKINLQHHVFYSSRNFFSFGQFHLSRVRNRRGWIYNASQARQRLALHTSILNLNDSKWSAGVTQHISQLKSRVDAVSKAVSGTQTKLLSRIPRLKPKVISPTKINDVEAKLLPDMKTVPASAIDVLAHASATKNSSTAPSSAILSSSIIPVDVNTSTSTHPHTYTEVSVAAILTVREVHKNQPRRTFSVIKASGAEKPDKRPTSLKDREIESETVKQTSRPLFHPSAFSVNLDETYNYLANHINSYFGTQDKIKDSMRGFSSSQAQQTSGVFQLPEKTSQPATITPSTKKSLGEYLTSSAPTVQAFVGSYIAPLVPKFRSLDYSKDETKAERTVVKQAKKTISKEQTAAEEKAKKLLIQREKIIAKVSVDNRTRALVQALYRASDIRVHISRVEDLSYHLLEFPDTRGVAIKERVIPCLLRLMQTDNAALRSAVREALALIGYHQPVKGRGVRILSIDGGGLRGILALQTLQKLEKLTGKPVYKLFDYICGVSTGAVLGFMLGVHQIPIKDCDDIYRKLGTNVFKQNLIVGTMKMSWSHAFYDSESWENILKEKMGSHLLVETSRNPECPKVAAVSTVVNSGVPLKAYVFRNYNLLPGVRSHYPGGCQHQLWQAIRATSAAPGYFQEFTLGSDLHQDGGLLINNPTALAIHECKCVWPNTPVECVVSLGTGRFMTAGKSNGTYTSLRTKLNNVINSATDTEEVHTTLDAFLPADTYFRFNPFLNEDISMDESRQEKLNLLQAEGIRYLDRNEQKLKKVAGILSKQKSSIHRVTDWAKLKADTYSGVPFKLK